MIGKQVTNLLNKQINAEIWSAYLYLSMSLDATFKNLNGVANWFRVQWQEELEHAKILQEYMNSQDAKVELQPIKEVPNSWASVLEMFKDALEHEMEVTCRIHEIAMLAQKEYDYATFSRMQWFIDEQVEEEQLCKDLIHLYKMSSDNHALQYQLDKDLAKRKYKMSEHLHAEHWIS
ncbi:MAG: ferritin [Bacteroidaceae bacterium]|nr:ferritin [Bacteroidaceae bacterium]